MVTTLRFVNLVLAALFVGGTFFTFYVLRPTLRRLSDAVALEVHRLTAHRVERYLPASTILSGLAAGAVLFFERRLDAPTILTAIGFVGTLCFGALSAVVVVPVNLRLAKAETVPPDLRAQFARWDRANAAEAFLGLAILGCYVAAALLA
jgi:hypothetical protein